MRCAGFSMIDLLVSIAVMAVLISILLPSLTRAQESARRVLCMGHMQQIGYAVLMYADEWGEHLPPATGIQEHREARFGPIRMGLFPRPLPDFQVDTMQARSMPTGSRSSTDRFVTPTPTGLQASKWEGLGVLLPVYLTHPEVCYCPSHRGNHPHDRYASAWRGQSGTIYINYQYRIPESSPYRKDLEPRTIILTDGMETKSDYSHIRGSNILRVDGSVGWYDDTEGKVYNSLPDSLEMTSPSGDDPDDPSRFPAWRELDDRGSRGSRRN